MSEQQLATELQAAANIHRIRKAVEKVDDELKTEKVESQRDELDFDRINDEFKL